jgi:hypothetical protein
VFQVVRLLQQKKPITNTYDVSLEDQLNVLTAVSSLQDDIFVPRISKKELISIHLSSITLSKESSSHESQGR